MLNNEKPLLILALPSSGSDWLMRCLAATDGVRIGECKELFNPILNAGREDWNRFDYYFPCELTDSMEKIFGHGGEEFRFARALFMQQLVNESKVNVAKDAWMFAQCDEFICDRFDVVFLVRETENTFPPKRARVFQWYSQIFDAIPCSEKLDLKPDLSLMEKCLFAHEYCLFRTKHMECTGLPVISYENLTTQSEEWLCRYLNESLPHWIDSQSLANEIVSTRKVVSRDPV